MFSSIHKDLVCWSPSRCAPKQRMKLESPCERAFDVSPLTFLLVAQEVAAIDASYRKVIPVQEIILVCEKTEVRNFLCVLSLVSSPIITYFQEFKTKRRCLLQCCFCLGTCKAQCLCFREIKRKSNFTKTIASFFLYMKTFLFSRWLSIFKTSNIFWKKSNLNGHSFMGCIGDIYCAAISTRSLMVLSKLNSVTLSISVQILFYPCWKIFIDT